MAAKKSEAHWEKEAQRIREKLGADKAFTEDHIMTFGKYKGKPLKDVPEEYLLWMYTDSDLLEKVRLFMYINQDLPLIMGIAHEKRKS
jgi:uncharacterized protein (DUF3820 family)